MGVLEIFFILSMIALMVMWGWFVVLGFRANHRWGMVLLFLFPLSPFAFAYRFERKTRKIIYYFVGSLVFFSATTSYAWLSRVDFFPTLLTTLHRAAPDFSFSAEPEKKQPLNLPKPAEIPVIVDEPEPAPTPVPEEVKPVVKETEPLVKLHGYKAVSLGSLQDYIGKKVQITTATVVHEGRLLAVSSGAVEIRKRLSGGATIMSVNKSKIIKVAVYL